MVLPNGRLQDLPLFSGEVVRLFDPQDVDTFQRFDFINRPPDAVKQEFGPGMTVDNAIFLDLKPGRQPEPLYLVTEQGID